MKTFLLISLLLPLSVLAQTDSLLILNNNKLLLVSIQDFINSAEYKTITTDTPTQNDSTTAKQDSKHNNRTSFLPLFNEDKKKKQP